jgi:hypothetical protein
MRFSPMPVSAIPLRPIDAGVLKCATPKPAAPMVVRHPAARLALRLSSRIRPDRAKITASVSADRSTLNIVALIVVNRFAAWLQRRRQTEAPEKTAAHESPGRDSSEISEMSGEGWRL